MHLQNKAGPKIYVDRLYIYHISIANPLHHEQTIEGMGVSYGSVKWRHIW